MVKQFTNIIFQLIGLHISMLGIIMQLETGCFLRLFNQL